MSRLESPPPTPPYITDIHAQPTALQQLLDAGLPAEVMALMGRLDSFERIVLTGMGASLFAQHPTFLALAAAGLPVWNLDTAELLGQAGGLLNARTLLWITSQSGSSAEVGALLDRLPEPRPLVLGSTNDAGSLLALRSDVVLPLHSGEERTVSTRSYVNTLAAHALAMTAAIGAPSDGLTDAPDMLAGYLADWEAHVASFTLAVREPTLFVVGRGPSVASAWTGALIAKEAAKVAVEAMSAPQFRHGPLELADADVGVIVLAGADDDVAPNRLMVEDVRRLGANGVWLDVWDGTPGDRPSLPRAPGAAALPIAETIALQALSVALAARRELEPGAFRHIEKVTRTL